MKNQQSAKTMTDSQVVEQNAQVIGNSFGDLAYPGSEQGSARAEQHFTEDTLQSFEAKAHDGTDQVSEAANMRLNEVYDPDIFSSDNPETHQKLQKILSTTPKGAHPFYHVIGTLGGNAVAAKYGQEFYKHIGARGGKSVREKYSAENLAKMGLMSEKQVNELQQAHNQGTDHTGTQYSEHGDISHDVVQDGDRTFH